MADYFTAMFRRRPNDGWFRAGRFDLTTTDILCALAVLTMFIYGLMGVDDWIKLPFQSWEVRENLDLWRLVTWPVASQPDAWDLLGVVFFWVFGQQLEAMFGRDKFLGWILIVALGGNDGLRGLSVEDMKGNLSAMVERAQARGIAVVLAGMEAPPNFGAAYTVEFRKAFREVADRYEVVFVPFLLQDVAGVADLNQPDGIHPNPEGARRVAEHLWPALQPLLDRLAPAK